MAAKKYQFVTIPISPQKGAGDVTGWGEGSQSEPRRGVHRGRDIQQTGTGLELAARNCPSV